MEDTYAAIDQLLGSRERFLAFVRRRIADPELAEDVLQASLLKAIQAAPRLRDEDRLVPWFYRILRNAIVDSYRRRAAAPREGELDLAANIAEPEEEERRVVCAYMEPLIAGLKPEYREIVQALDLNDETAESFAARRGLTATNLKVRRHRARRALRSRLEQVCMVCAEHHCLDCTCGTEARI